MPDEHLAEFLRTRAAPYRQGAEEFAVPPSLPESGAGYQAHSRPSAQPVYALHCLLGAGGCRSFQLVHLDSNSSLTAGSRGQVITLRFCGTRIVDVTIHGRNLRMLYDYLHQHRIGWIMQVEPGRDFASDGEAVITRIDISEVREGGMEYGTVPSRE